MVGDDISGKASSKYDPYRFNSSKIKYDKTVFDRLNEAEEWIKYLEKGQAFQKGKHNGNRASLVEGLNSFLGYFFVIRGKLKDELVFGKDNLRGLSIQIRRLEKDLDSKKSDLELQVKERDLALEGYNAIGAEKDRVNRHSTDYITIQEEYFHKKKEKEAAEGAVSKNALVCKTLIQSIELMKLSAEQSKMSLDQGEEILKRVGEAIGSMNTIYQKMAILVRDKKQVLQITDGGGIHDQGY